MAESKERGGSAIRRHAAGEGMLRGCKLVWRTNTISLLHSSLCNIYIKINWVVLSVAGAFNACWHACRPRHFYFVIPPSKTLNPLYICIRPTSVFGRLEIAWSTHFTRIILLCGCRPRDDSIFICILRRAAAAPRRRALWCVGAIKSGRLIFMATRGDMHSFVYCHAKIAQQNHFHALLQTFLTGRRWLSKKFSQHQRYKVNN